MFKTGIVGYGNLGKDLEKVVRECPHMQLEAVFSRRKCDCKKYVPFANIDDFAGKIDLLFLAMGSYDDITVNAPPLCGKFHTVDSYDNHLHIAEYKQSLAAKCKDKISIVSAGWDPGIMSMARALFSAYPGQRTASFWGKGVSQGHTNAIRSIKGVKDAVQFTVPRTEIYRAAKKGVSFPKTAAQAHQRICYVACDEKDRAETEREIVNMPDYFAPYQTTVNFISEKEVAEMKKDLSHKGCVVSSNKGGRISLEISTFRNPLFTAYTMLAYASAAEKMAAEGLCGVYDCLDIPLKYLAADKSML